MGKTAKIAEMGSATATPLQVPTTAKMKSMIVLFVVLAVAQINAAPAPQFFGLPGGSGVGFGTGNAGPFGSSATGLATSNAYNGGVSSSSGNGFGSSGLFGYNAGGNGFSNSFGK